jgi:hypothetical protein
MTLSRPELDPGVSKFAEVSHITRHMHGAERLCMILRPTLHEGMVPS